MEEATSFILEDQTYQYIGDLEYFEGALLSVFQRTEDDTLFILHWLNTDKAFNSWYFFPTTPRALGLYLEGKLSNQDLFFLDGQKDVLVIELNGDMELGKIERQEKTQIPPKLVPSKEGFFEKLLCPNLQTFAELLKKYGMEAGNYKFAMAA